MRQARSPAPTVAFVDDYCAQYRDLFSDVREFEQFSVLHVGLLAETKRKSLPRLAKTGHADAQAWHHFLSKAHWSTAAWRARRLQLLRQALGETPFMLCIDETGDRKKGHTTDYVAHQYIGNVHTLANGIVSVNAYGVLNGVTFPPRLLALQTQIPPQARRCLPEQAAVSRRVGAAAGGGGISLQRRARRQHGWGELRLHQRSEPVGHPLCGRHALQPRRMDCQGRATTPDARARLCPHVQ